MAGDSSNRRNFLKAMGVTAVSMALPAGLGTGAFLSAAPAAAEPGMGALELWLLDTGKGSLDAGLYELSHQYVVATLGKRGEKSLY
jgi:hypothetical protein